ncbi:MAG: hypothetical protein D6732_14345 [Methanobacteriota archaeon]|nr:MAG: hypothetical protein D6732_14345 [Euryarchaeota archaeon]
MHYFRYSQGITIDHDRISVKEALELVQHQETASTNKDNYLGFTYEDSDATIQFVRKSHTKWIMDVPYYHDGEFVKAKDSEVSHSVVLDIVDRFFNPSDPMTKALIEGKYDDFEKIIEKEYGIVLLDVDLERELQQWLNDNE